MSPLEAFTILASVAALCGTFYSIVRFAFGTRIDGLEDLMGERFNGVDRRFTAVDKRFDDLRELLDVRFAHVEKTIQEGHRD